jgi:hypothetical protein
MKKIVFMLASLFMLQSVVSAQIQQRDRDRDRIHLYDHYMFKDGAVYQMRDQDQVRLREQLKLNNGTLLNPDGSCLLQNGRNYQLRNGECLGPDGKMYKSQERFRQKMQLKEKQLNKADRRAERMNMRQKNRMRRPS